VGFCAPCRGQRLFGFGGGLSNGSHTAAQGQWPWVTNRPRATCSTSRNIRLGGTARIRPTFASGCGPARRPHAAGDPDCDSAVAQVAAGWQAHLGPRRMEQRAEPHRAIAGPYADH
jgi:hypothetical protein